MYFYKLEDENGLTLFQSLKEPKNKDGLIEIDENEYTELFNAINEEVE